MKALKYYLIILFFFGGLFGGYWLYYRPLIIKKNCLKESLGLKQSTLVGRPESYDLAVGSLEDQQLENYYRALRVKVKFISVEEYEDRINRQAGTGSQPNIILSSDDFNLRNFESRFKQCLRKNKL